jgi:hypothetical protein
VETDTVPKTEVQLVSLYIKIPGTGSEPIGQRIVEVPDDATWQWELGSARREPGRDTRHLWPVEPIFYYRRFAAAEP